MTPIPVIQLTTEEEALVRKIKREVKKWQKRMGLADWQVLVKLVEPIPGEADFFAAVDPYAEITPYGLHYWAELRVNRKEPPLEGQLKWVIVHELCHLLVHHFREFTTPLLECFPTEYAAAWEKLRDIKEEQLVQKLCEAIVGAKQPWLLEAESQ